jgi:hypothetical protein
VDLLRDLYLVEQRVEGGSEEALARRAKTRNEESRAILERINQWAQRTLLTALPQSGLAEAIGYMLANGTD